ncbi:nitroreductase family protein [Actinopolymorpha pittospori]|uniref:Nitroreductase n=1 Tax=Actinopolymorpha pittospori TaxID=648752 RepID=A0A927N385_9ACTN|nr:nitroreductase family protein [Actinopolymorpha pittospori]MBE1609478.1 nitroreductase [Actinopolymorpha pittospori]
MSQPFDTDITDHLLSTTRAVRKRLDLERPVEREVLLDCIRIATQAPSGSNAQGWRFVIVTDPDKRARMAELYRAGGAPYMKWASENSPADEQAARVMGSARHLVEIIDQVPVLVVPCIEGRVTDIRHAAAFFGSIHPAIWSFQLALRSRGLGSVWTTFHLQHEEEAAELLGIPADVTQAALLPVAYTIGTDFRPAKRRPVEEITFWDSWGHTVD